MERMTRDYAGAQAGEYDRRMDVLFKTFGADEQAVREQLAALLDVKPGARILETGCGTCRDSAHLASRAGSIIATDLSADMIRIGRDRLRAGGAADHVRLCVSDATALPFASAVFDAAYHFGGVNLFGDVARGLAEMARVVKPGGRVVVGDEGLAPWLAESEFGRILVNTNPLYRYQPPLALLPVSARNVACRWILNGAFYVIDFTVGEGEPFLDLDVEFPGWRGGSHRTRFYGRLDGVDPALKQQVVNAAAASGLSVTAWLERALRKTLNS
jgi:SAM-dependent methyltransferase